MIQSSQKYNLLKYTFLGSIFLIFFVLYADYFKYDPLLGRDDNLLVTPLMNIDSLEEYFQKMWENEILDVQPLRDFTFWINIKVKDWFGLSTFHLFNFLVFCVLITLVFNLFQFLFENRYFPFLFSLLFAVHPLLVSAVGWVSARKHSLATAFILMGIINFLKKKNINYFTVLSYVLSLCTHQIYLLFPLWILIFSHLKKIKINKKLIFFMCFFCVLIVGTGYYKTFILNLGRVVYSEKDPYFANLSRYVLSLSRSIVLVFFPKSIAAAYYQGSYWNLLGIPLGVIFIYMVSKPKESKKDVFLWLFLAFLGFIPTVITFVNDTYLYLFFISILVVIAYFVTSINYLKLKNYLKFVFCVYFILLSCKTFDASVIWMSNARLWQYSYMNEKSPLNAIILSSHLKNEKTAVELLTWAAEHYDFSHNLQLAVYFATKIYLSTVITREEKLKIFKKFYYNYFVFEIYISLLYIEGDFEDAKIGFEHLKDLKSRWDSKEANPIYLKDIIKYTLKNICLKESRKRYFCKELGIQLGEKKP